MRKPKIAAVTCIPSAKLNSDNTGGYMVEFLSEAGYLPIPFLTNLNNFEDFFNNVEVSVVVFPGGEAKYFKQLLENPKSVTNTEGQMFLQKHQFEVQLTKYCIENDIPLVGLCSGTFVIALHHGIPIIDNHEYEVGDHLINVRGKHRSMYFPPIVEPLCMDINSIPNEFEIFANYVEYPEKILGIKHKTKPLGGMKWVAHWNEDGRDDEIETFRYIINGN